MKNYSTAEYFSRGLRWLRLIAWTLAILSVFCFGAAIVAYSQGRDLAEMGGTLDKYGDLFWASPNPNKEYTGMYVLSEERYNTCFLWIVTGAVLAVASIIAMRERNVIEHLSKERIESENE